MERNIQTIVDAFSGIIGVLKIIGGVIIVFAIIGIIAVSI